MHINVDGVTVNTTTLGINADQTTTLYAREAYLDPCMLDPDVRVMVDEEYDIEVTRKQGNAIAYFVKARLAEDTGDLKLREYFMRLFYKEIEEASNARKNGPNIIQGYRGMRK